MINQPTNVVEVVLFRLNEGADVEAFLRAAQATFDLLASQKGYLSRELSVADDGLWTDIVHWADLETALSAANSIMTDPLGQAFGAYIAAETIVMTHVHPRISTVSTLP